jgi:hypothetical protein
MLPLYRQILPACPVEFQDWLRNYMESCITDDDLNAVGSPSQIFCRELSRFGFVRAILYNINQDDADAKDVRRGAENRVPDAEIVWPIIRYAISREEEDCWRKLALKWAPKYAPNPDVAVARLSDGLQEAFPIAALYLCELAPQTPGLAAVLAAALDYDWSVSTVIASWSGITGPGLAAIALAKLQAAERLPELRAAVLDQGQDFPAIPNRALALDAYVQLAAEPAAIALIEEVMVSGLGELLTPTTDQASNHPYSISWQRSWPVSANQGAVPGVFWAHGIGQIWETVMRHLGVR